MKNIYTYILITIITINFSEAQNGIKFYLQPNANKNIEMKSFYIQDSVIRLNINLINKNSIDYFIQKHRNAVKPTPERILVKWRIKTSDNININNKVLLFSDNYSIVVDWYPDTSNKKAYIKFFCENENFGTLNLKVDEILSRSHIEILQDTITFEFSKINELLKQEFSVFNSGDETLTVKMSLYSNILSYPYFAIVPRVTQILPNSQKNINIYFSADTSVCSGKLAFYDQYYNIDTLIINSIYLGENVYENEKKENLINPRVFFTYFLVIILTAFLGYFIIKAIKK